MVLFGFCDTENLDLGSEWATLNHLLQQGIFWLSHIFCMISPHIFKYNFDKIFKFLHHMGIFRKVCPWDSNDHYTWHLVFKKHLPGLWKGLGRRISKVGHFISINYVIYLGVEFIDTYQHNGILLQNTLVRQKPAALLYMAENMLICPPTEYI